MKISMFSFLSLQLYILLVYTITVNSQLYPIPFQFGNGFGFGNGFQSVPHSLMPVPPPMPPVTSGSGNTIPPASPSQIYVPPQSQIYEPSVSQQLASNIATFSDAMYQALLPNTKGNMIFSPFSVQTALAMMYCGAEGETATELQDGLVLGNFSQQGVANNFNTLLQPFQSNTDLDIANAIYLMKGFRIQPNYQTIVTQKFYSSINLLNFANSKKSANTINQWVEQETHDKIKNLVSAQDFNAATRLVLVNAIYFNGTWQHKFTSTNQMPFYTNGCASGANGIEQTEMMHVSKKFSFGNIAKLNAAVLELPYTSDNPNIQLTMLIVLPNDCMGLDALQNALITYNMASIGQNMFSRTVHVTMPKFKTKSTFNLNGPLSKMGMVSMFSDSANFDGILEFGSSSREQIKVSKVVHKAYIEVNENGTVAAAATAVEMVYAMAMEYSPPPVYFNANHPFIYFIRSNNDILFMGRFIG